MQDSCGGYPAGKEDSVLRLPQAWECRAVVKFDALIRGKTTKFKRVMEAAGNQAG